MMLLRGGSSKGAEWASNRKVPQIAFKPDSTKAREGSSVQTQRRDARGPADRRHALPGNGKGPPICDVPAWAASVRF